MNKSNFIPNTNHMKKLSFFFLILISILPLQGQAYLLDEKDNSPIPFAQILNEKGAIIGLTDIEGQLPKLPNKEGTITIQHLSYQTKEIPLKKVLKSKNIHLAPLAYDLAEVDVNAKKLEYIRLHGYYRSYQLNDSCIKYYTDGIVEFYIPVKSGEVKRQILKDRKLKNSSLTDKDKVRKKHVADHYISSPYLEKKTLIESIKGDAFHGVIKKDTISKICRIEHDALALKKNKSGSLFGYTVRLAAIYDTETYNLQEDYQSYMDLLNQKRYRKLFYKHKKDSLEQQIEIIDELYIMEREYISQKDMKDAISKQKSSSKSSQYPNEYWNNPQIPKLNRNLETTINTEMTPFS